MVCLLNLKKTWELLILGVQANKLHFCNLSMMFIKDLIGPKDNDNQEVAISYLQQLASIQNT